MQEELSDRISAIFTTMNGHDAKLQAASMRQSLFDEGYLDDHFTELEGLQDEDNPHFVEEVVNIFFTDSVRYVDEIAQALARRPLNFGRVDDCVVRFKGSCSSIGAAKLNNECVQLREYCEARDLEGCTRSFQTARQEHATLREKLEAYLELVREAGPAV